MSRSSSAPKRSMRRRRRRGRRRGARRSPRPRAMSAPVGSPSTPLRETALTPSARSRGTSSAIGAVAPAAARSMSHQLGAQEQHQRRLGVPGMGVAAREVGPPRQHTAALRGQRCDGQIDGVPVAAMPIDEHHAARPVGRADELDDDVHHDLGADRQGAREPGVFTAGRDADRRRDDDPRPVARRGRRRGARRRSCPCPAAGVGRAARTSRSARRARGSPPRTRSSRSAPRPPNVVATGRTAVR